MLEIIPLKQKLNTEITIQGAKNYSLRAQFCACYAQGASIIRNSYSADDLDYTANALRLFGNQIEKIDQTTYKIIGRGRAMLNPKQDIYIEGSGVAMRFLTSYAALAPGQKILTGNERMLQRPISELLTGLKSLGVDCFSQNKNGCPPVVINSQGISGGECEIPGNISSQFFSSICLAAPYAQKDVIIKVTGGMTSRGHFAATLDIMKDFGIETENDNFKIIKIKAGQKYQPRDYQVEGDWPSATYFMGLAAITGSTIKILGLNPDSLQGEKCFLTALEQMGCTVVESRPRVAFSFSGGAKSIKSLKSMEDYIPIGSLAFSGDENYIEVTGPKELKGIEFSNNDLTDAAQTLMVVAAFAKGKTTIRNLENLRIKESDRISDMARELKKIGCEVKEYPDGLTITPGQLHGAEIETYNDHRTAMSFALIGTKVAGIKIKNPECVKKSYLNYWQDLQRLGIIIR